MAKISMMTMVFGGLLEQGRLADMDMLQAIEDMGYDGVELPSRRLLDRPGRLKAYRAYLADSPLCVTCVDGGCNLVGPDKAAREAGRDALRAAIDAAVLLRSPLVLAAGSRLSGSITAGDGRRMIIEGLNACLPFASEAGVSLAIENFAVAPTLQCAARHCAEILDAVPGLRFIFDAGNFYFCGEEPLDNIPRLGPKTCYLHLKDWVKSGAPQIADVAGAPLGAGFIPNEEIVRRFLHAGQVECFSVEIEGPGNKLERAEKEIETVRQWLSNAETQGH